MCLHCHGAVGLTRNMRNALSPLLALLFLGCGNATTTTNHQDREDAGYTPQSGLDAAPDPESSRATGETRPSTSVDSSADSTLDHASTGDTSRTGTTSAGSLSSTSSETQNASASEVVDGTSSNSSDEECHGDDCAPDGCPADTTTDAAWPGVCVRVCQGTEVTVVTSAEEVATLAQRACTIIEGGLAVNGAVTDLTGLESVRKIDGTLTIAETTSLATLAGLEGLEHLEGSLVLMDNRDLTSLSGLESLRRVNGGVVALNNPKLERLEELNNTEFQKASFTLAGNDALESLDGLEGVTLAESIVIADHLSLFDVSGLSNLTEVLSLTLTNNATVGAIDYQALFDVQSLTVAGNPNLDDLRFPNLISAGDVIVTSNQRLATLDLSSLSTVNTLSIAENEALRSIGSLEALVEVQALNITMNPELPQCSVDAIAERLECVVCGDNAQDATCD